jgi:hypothetical protein
VGVVLLAVAGTATPVAAAFSCPNTPLEDRLKAADVAFVGRIVGERPATGGRDLRSYRFVVDQRVKGPIGREVEIRSARLVDLDDTPVPRDVAVGVLASTASGGALVTSSCGLSDPGALLSTADEPRGTLIKIVVGLVILAAALAYSLRRLRRRGKLVSG